MLPVDIVTRRLSLLEDGQVLTIVKILSPTLHLRATEQT